MISFDNFDSYGEVKFLTGDLNPYLYPTVFEAKWNKMEHKTDHLLISDVHTKNSDIGKYDVKIIPLEKFEINEQPNFTKIPNETCEISS